MKTTDFTHSLSRRGLLSATGLAALLAFAASTASAQDKATLDLLVQKNVITQADEDNLAKSAAAPVVVTPKDGAVKGLKLEGLIQSQFDSLTTNDKAAGAGNPPGNNQFLLRRAYLGAQADLGNGWGGEIVFDFASGAQAPSGYQSNGSNAAQNNFEKIIITKKVDDYSGLFTAGFQKVNFTLEEYTSTTAVKPIERSIVSSYFDNSDKGQTSRRLGFASRHNGLYWDGKIPALPGLSYGLAVTTGIQNSSGYSSSSGGTTSAGYTGGLNRLGTWAYVAYGGNVGDIGYKAGLNFGYSADGNSIATQANSIWGYNPVLTLTYGSRAQLDAEFLQARVTNGAAAGAPVTATGTATHLASPYGFNITPSYKINDQWELVARYSYLNTNGRGTSIADVLRDAPDITTSTSASTAPVLFDSAQELYLGVNWYLVGNSVKFSLGYELARFNDRGNATGNVNAGALSGPSANVQGVRARLQLVF